MPGSSLLLSQAVHAASWSFMVTQVQRLVPGPAVSWWAPAPEHGETAGVVCSFYQDVSRAGGTLLLHSLELLLSFHPNEVEREWETRERKVHVVCPLNMTPQPTPATTALLQI